MASAQVCTSCAAENPAGARFCISCGTALERSCPACGTPAPEQARFCPACGSALDVPAGPPSAGAEPEAGRALGEHLPLDGAARREAVELSREERRTVTVLFADLSGYTAISETLDPEAVKALVDRALRVLPRRSGAWAATWTSTSATT
jgi:Double zinc ribbon